MSNSDFDVSSGCSDEECYWDRSSLPSGSNLSFSFQNNQSRRPGALGPVHAANLPGNLPWPSAAYHVSSTVSTRSTGSYVYTNNSGQGVSSISPRIVDSALRQPRGTDSESGTDPILLRFASHSTSLAGQISGLGSHWTLSSGNVDSEDTGSGSEGLNSLEEQQTVETPNTSETGDRDDDIFALDQDPLDPGLNRASLFVGLEFPEALRHPLFSSGTNSDSISDLNEILELNGNPQARPDAASWVPNTDTLPNPAEVSRAPSPGPTYNAYHSPMRQYTRESEIYTEEKIITGRFRVQSLLIGCSRGLVTAKPESSLDASLISQISGDQMRSHHRPSRDQHNTITNLKLFRGIDCMSSCLITKVPLFHPVFLVSHLFADSVSTFTAQTCAPNTYIDSSEYPAYISLGFGPDICFEVSPFTPKDKEALRCFQKHERDDTLHVKDSIPIALNCFSVESTAETLDDWLDEIVDSPSNLLEYTNLMMERHRKNLSAKTLKIVVSWFLAVKSKLPESPRKIIRNALKLLITITTLMLVPKVTRLPSSLSARLPQWVSSGVDSVFVAPKLLTRQIKSSTYHLQVQLLGALFSDLVHGKELVAQIKLSVALIVSFGLELVSDSARTFARYANKINHAVSVQDIQVKDYERNMERDVFDRIRASVYDYPHGIDAQIGGGLGDRLRSIQSSGKGKGKEDEKCRFVSAILTPVF